MTDPQTTFSETRLDDRWSLGPELTQNALGIWHAAFDHVRQEKVQLFQLLPIGSHRFQAGMTWPKDWPAETIRSLYREELLKIQHLRLSAVRRIRDIFEEGHTIWFAQSLEPPQLAEIDEQKVKELLLSAADGLAPLHQRRRLLLAPSGSWSIAEDGIGRLRQPGLTAAWIADVFGLHDQLYDSSECPAELGAADQRRGPGTDYYLAAASLLRMLDSGDPRKTARQLPRPMREAFERCLDERLDARPANPEELRHLLDRPEAFRSSTALSLLDQKRKMLHMLRVDPMSCPACDGVLNRMAPLKDGRCPCCLQGVIEDRKLPARICPSCRVGILQRWQKKEGPQWCPSCGTGRMAITKGISKFRTWTCGDCGQKVEGRPPDWLEIHEQSGRSESGWCCDVCEAVFDDLPDGRWRRATTDALSDGWITLWPEEWRRLSAGLSADAGNAHCQACGSAFHRSAEGLTLTDCLMAEPSPYAQHFEGQFVTHAAAQRFAMGIQQANDQELVCPSCQTCFAEEETLTLRHTHHPLLRPLIGESRSLPDWRRIALELPAEGAEETLEDDLRAAVSESYREGRLNLSQRREDLLWEGHAVLMVRKPSSVKVLVFQDHIRYRRRIRQRRVELEEIVDLTVEQETLHLDYGDGRRLAFVIQPTDWDVKLSSGKISFTITADDLAARIGKEISRPTTPSPDAARAQQAGEKRADRTAD